MVFFAEINNYFFISSMKFLGKFANCRVVTRLQHDFPYPPPQHQRHRIRNPTFSLHLLLQRQLYRLARSHTMAFNNPSPSPLVPSPLPRLWVPSQSLCCKLQGCQTKFTQFLKMCTTGISILIIAFTEVVLSALIYACLQKRTDTIEEDQGINILKST